MANVYSSISESGRTTRSRMLRDPRNASNDLMLFDESGGTATDRQSSWCHEPTVGRPPHPIDTDFCECLAVSRAQMPSTSSQRANCTNATKSRPLAQLAWREVPFIHACTSGYTMASARLKNTASCPVGRSRFGHSFQCSEQTSLWNAACCSPLHSSAKALP